jgi:hypothetical protein
MNFARSLQCELGKNEHNEEEWGQETIDSTSVNLELGLKWWKIRFESFSDEMWIVECDCNAGDGAPSSSPPWPAAVSAELRALSLLGQLFPSWPCLKLQVPFSSIETVGQHPSSIMIGKVLISNAQTKSPRKVSKAWHAMPHWAFPIRTSAPSLSHVRSKIAIIVSIINRFMTFMTYALRYLSDTKELKSQ